MEDKRVLIVEDEVLIAYHIVDLLNSIKITNVEMAHSFPEAMTKIDSFQPQLLILDINLNASKNGIDIAQKLNEKKPIPLIFLTANTDSVRIREAIGVKPHAILTKPIKSIDLLSNVSLFFSNHSDETKKIKIKYNGEVLLIGEDDILYGKIEDNYLNLYTHHKKYVIRTSIENFLESNNFSSTYQCHRSYIVNFKKIRGFKSMELYVENDVVPVSRSYKKKVEEIINCIVNS